MDSGDMLPVLLMLNPVVSGEQSKDRSSARGVTRASRFLYQQDCVQVSPGPCQRCALCVGQSKLGSSEHPDPLYGLVWGGTNWGYLPCLLGSKCSQKHIPSSGLFTLPQIVEKG